MHQPVDSCRSGHWIFKNLFPLGKRQIAGNHQAASFITIGKKGKQHFHFLAALLDVSDVIDDDRIIA